MPGLPLAPKPYYHLMGHSLFTYYPVFSYDISTIHRFPSVLWGMPVVCKPSRSTSCEPVFPILCHWAVQSVWSTPSPLPLSPQTPSPVPGHGWLGHAAGHMCGAHAGYKYPIKHGAYLTDNTSTPGAPASCWGSQSTTRLSVQPCPTPLQHWAPLGHRGRQCLENVPTSWSQITGDVNSDTCQHWVHSRTLSLLRNYGFNSDILYCACSFLRILGDLTFITGSS